jgi:MATE family multidrug resistance protein
MMDPLRNHNLTPSHADARDLLRLALPLIAVSASRMLMGFIDFVMVSQLGTAAQAAISPASLLVFTFLCLGMGAATSVQTFASQADGRGEPERGAAYAWQTLYMALALGPLVWPLSQLMPGLYAWVAGVAGHSAEVQALETDYTRITVWSLTPAVVAVGLESFFNGVQRPRVTLIAVLVSVVTNIIGNYLLIWGKFGCPQLGIYGAGLATVIGWWARVAVLLVAFCSSSVDARYHTRRAWRPRLAEWRDILRIGGPTSLSWMIDLGSWVVFLNLIMPMFGTVALAATNVGLQYTHLAFMPAIGIGMALCSQVGFAIGAGRPEEAARRTQTALRLTMGYMGLIGLVLFLLRGPLMGLLSADPAVIDGGRWVLTWAALYQVFDAMTITYISALRGAGDTRVPAILNGICCWGLFVGGGWLIARWRPGWDLNGPWLMAVLYLTIVGLLVFWRYHTGAWRRIRVFGADAARAGE